MPEIEDKSYLESLTIKELVDLKEVVWKMRHNHFSWSSTKNEYAECTGKIELIDKEIKRRLDLIK